MPIVTGVRFKESGRTYYFNPLNFDIKPGDSVIVETARGLEYGDVIIGRREVEESQVVTPLKNVVRIATEKDELRLVENVKKQKESFSICEERIEKHALPMKLIDVEYTFDRKKILFYFTSDGRVDFRELVKDLASTFKTRIELRQIGVRDEAKLLGGLGSCGREVCCKSFLADFRPVSIKMAKDQNISLNPTKISGLCGRLMCCLEYEHKFYEEAKKQLRRRNSSVLTPNGPGYVLDNLMLQEKCKVKVVAPGDNFEVMYFKYEELKDITEEEMEEKVKKIKAMPTNAFNINNPYETWDDEEQEKNKQQNKNRQQNKNYRKKRYNKNRNTNKNNTNSANNTNSSPNKNSANTSNTNVKNKSNSNTRNNNNKSVGVNKNNYNKNTKDNNTNNNDNANGNNNTSSNKPSTSKNKSRSNYYKGKVKYNPNKSSDNK